MSRSPFDALVDDYDAARPSYPPGLYEGLDRLAGPLAGARLVEVGAGTGIATRELVARGADVLALDIGPGMLARLRRRSPGVPAAVADAHSLPLPAAEADLVCFAQAWHWVRVAAAVDEASRVLRPGGALAVWWNDVEAHGLDWFDAQQQRLEAESPGYRRTYRSRDYGAELEATGAFATIEHADWRWTRTLDVDTYLAWLRSKSYVAALGDRLDDFLAAERESLSAAFPQGEVSEPFRTRLWVARTPRPS